MDTTMKNSLKSAGILVAIAVVAVLMLALANALLPKYEPKLDLATVQELNQMSPTGVDDQTALDEGYFVIPAGFDLEEFNGSKTIGGAGDRVLAVYRAENGDNKGTVFVETSTSGNASGLRLLTAIKDGKIVDTILVATSESPGYTDFSKIKAAVIGQGEVTGDLLAPVSSGATLSRNGFVKGFSLAFAVYNQVGEE